MSPENPKLPLHQRITDAAFRRAVELLDSGDAESLRAHLHLHPGIVRQRVAFEEGNYFRNPALLSFAAENPIRRGTLPANIVSVVQVILEAGAQADTSALDETLGLVCSGGVPRECGVQLPLIDLLVRFGANPDSATAPALVHGEFDAVKKLLQLGARMNLPIAAVTGRVEDARQLFAASTDEQRQSALALAAQFGHLEILRFLLNAGEDPDRYSPLGTHSHSTPLHQAALAGHFEIVLLLVERGARLDLKDTLFDGTPADWAQYAGETDIEKYLRLQEPNI